MGEKIRMTNVTTKIVSLRKMVQPKLTSEEYQTFCTKLDAIIATMIMSNPLKKPPRQWENYLSHYHTVTPV